MGSLGVSKQVVTAAEERKVNCIRGGYTESFSNERISGEMVRLGFLTVQSLFDLGQYALAVEVRPMMSIQKAPAIRVATTGRHAQRRKSIS